MFSLSPLPLPSETTGPLFRDISNTLDQEAIISMPRSNIQLLHSLCTFHVRKRFVLPLDQ